MYVGGRIILPRLFAQAARTKSPELFLAASLAGRDRRQPGDDGGGAVADRRRAARRMLIAETEYHSEVEVDDRAVQGAGAGRVPDLGRDAARPGAGAENWAMLAAAMLGVIAVKAA